MTSAKPAEALEADEGGEALCELKHNNMMMIGCTACLQEGHSLVIEWPQEENLERMHIN